MDLDDTLLRFDKMLFVLDSGQKTMKKSKGPISYSPSSVKSNTAGCCEGENYRCVVVEIGAVVHYEKSNQ